MKLIVDLMYQGGLTHMRQVVSDTAEYGDYVTGPRVIDDHVQATLRQVLTEIQNGEFAKRWIQENQAGRPAFLAMRRHEQEQPIEQVGKRLRSMMSWLNRSRGPCLGAGPPPEKSSPPLYERRARAMAMRRVRIFDTTLRDGEQARGR